MTKEESLAILGSVCKQMESMSESELFDYMMSNSETFRNHIDELSNIVEIILDLHNMKQDFSSSQKEDDSSSDFTRSNDSGSYTCSFGDDIWLWEAA